MMALSIAISGGLLGVTISLIAIGVTLSRIAFALERIAMNGDKE